MITVLQLLNQKDQTISSIDPDATVFDAITKMAENNIGSLLVMGDGEELVGIITERDYTRNVVLKGHLSPTTPVREIMERRVIFVLPEQTVVQMHGSHERQARAPSASARRQESDWYRINRRSR